MKKDIRSGIFMLIGILILLSSCKKKPLVGPIPENNCETKYQVLYGDAVSTNETASVTYQNDQIKSISSSNGSFSYEYLPDQVTISAAGTSFYRIEISGNIAKKIIDLKGSSEERLTYDANRNLIKIETYLNNSLINTKALTYANGNLASLTETFTDDPDVKKVTVFSYSSDVAGKVESETRHLIFPTANLYIPLGLTGSISKNLLSGSVYTYTSGNFRSDITKTYAYTKNASGLTDKIVENSHSITVSNGVTTQDETIKQTVLISSTCK
jgi:hypothetical protein